MSILIKLSVMVGKHQGDFLLNLFGFSKVWISHTTKSVQLPMRLFAFPYPS